MLQPKPLRGNTEAFGIDQSTANECVLTNALFCCEVIVTLDGFKHHLRDALVLIAK